MNNDFDAVSVDCEEMEQDLENENKEEESREERKGSSQFPVEERHSWGGVAEKRVVINAPIAFVGDIDVEPIGRTFQDNGLRALVLVHSLRDIAWWLRLPEVVTINDVCQMIVVRTTEWAEHVMPFLSLLGRWAKPAVWIGRPIHVNGVAWLEPAQTVELDIDRLVFMGAPRIVQRGGSALYKKRYQSDDHRSGVTKPKRFRPVEDQPSHSGWIPAIRTIRPVEDQPSHSGWTPAIRTIRPVEDLQQHQSSSNSHLHRQQPFPAKAVYDFWKLEIIPPIPPFVNDRAPFCRRVQIEKGGEVLGFFNQQFYFSNFNEAYEFVIHGRTYRCVEQYYCAQKTLYLKRFDAADAIMLGTNKYGKRISPFEMKKIAHMNGEEEVTVREWTELKVGIMEEALKAKFSVPDLKDVLLSTGSAIICELSPDQFWGVGCRPGLIYDKWPTANIKQWNGSNTLGRLLMQLRDDLKEATPKGTTQAVQPNHGRSKNGEENFQNIPVEEDVFDLKSFENLEITITDEAKKGYKPKKSTNANSISELLMSHADEVAETEETTNEKFALSERINQWLKYAGINCQVLVFGSSLCQLARHGSDLDLFIYKFDQTSIRLGDELGKSFFAEQKLLPSLFRLYPDIYKEDKIVKFYDAEFHQELAEDAKAKCPQSTPSVIEVLIDFFLWLDDIDFSRVKLSAKSGKIDRTEGHGLQPVIIEEPFDARSNCSRSLTDKEFQNFKSLLRRTNTSLRAKDWYTVKRLFRLKPINDVAWSMTDESDDDSFDKIAVEQINESMKKFAGIKSDSIQTTHHEHRSQTEDRDFEKNFGFPQGHSKVNNITIIGYPGSQRIDSIVGDLQHCQYDDGRCSLHDSIVVWDVDRRLVVSQQGFAIEEREFVKFNRQLDRTRRDVNFGEPLDGEVRTSQLDAQLTALLGTDLTHLNPNFLIRQLSDNQQIEAEWISQNILEIWPCSPVYEKWSATVILNSTRRQLCPGSEATIRRCNRHLCPLTLRSANLHFSLHIHRVISAPPLLGHPPSHQPPLSLHCPSFAPSSLGPTA
ncbi:hypothetical protein niasHS_004182 [Heterodera schachtii]|uniref:NADAR domain-containing protein n=1 Tax=Heterodera schachtii TaxID=97005 RepID=A0ABD2K0Y7_HETSC